MKTRVLLLLSLLVLGLGSAAVAQKKSKKSLSPASMSIEQLRREYYVVNRDSAYMDPRIALKKLMGGNRRFVEGKSLKPRQDSVHLHSVENGQKPFAVIVGCSDSRVPNEIIFDQGVGDLFIVRTAGQAMAQASYGSIEFAHLALGSKLIVVLGHEKCGAVDAAIKRPDNPPGHIVTLINAIKPAAEKSRNMPGDPLHNAIYQNVINQVNELRDLEPVLSKKYKEGKVLIVGAVYDLSTGRVNFIPETLASLP